MFRFSCLGDWAFVFGATDSGGRVSPDRFVFHIIVVADAVVTQSGFAHNTHRELIVEARMGVVGKSPNQRRRVSVKPSSSQKLETVDADTPSPQQVAAYIAEMCVEMVVMAKSVNLSLVAHLLAMAQAEAEYAAEKI